MCLQKWKFYEDGGTISILLFENNYFHFADFAKIISADFPTVSWRIFSPRPAWRGTSPAERRRHRGRCKWGGRCSSSPRWSASWCSSTGLGKKTTSWKVHSVCHLCKNVKKNFQAIFLLRKKINQSKKQSTLPRASSSAELGDWR